MNTIGKVRLRPGRDPGRSGLLDTHPKRPTVGAAAVRAPQGPGANGLSLERRAPALRVACARFITRSRSSTPPSAPW